MTSSAPDHPVPFIRRLRIENYKSIGYCDVTLGPFAVLLGLNAAGKSNFLDALRYVRDAATHGLSRSTEARGGLNELLRRTPEPTDHATIALECHIPSPQSDGALWEVRYELTVGHSHARETGVHVRREECIIGPPGGPPQARFLVRDMEVEDSVNTRHRRLTRGGPYLGLVRLTEPYAQFYDALSSMFFYEPDLTVLRDARPATQVGVLGENGSDVGSVLAQLGDWERERISAYAAAIVPHLTAIGPTAPDQNYVAAQMTTATGPNGTEQSFRAESLSEGTIRAVGLLTALFQPPARDGRIPLVALEEPELALHPMAAGVVFDALTEASTWTQVIATSQSAELFDRKEADLSAVLVAAADNGVTTIGPIDPVSRSIVSDGLATMGELLRSDQLRPVSTTDEPGEESHQR
ncbi:AAA family ATPase [Micromonospora endophytica]|uniref:Chromosome segregation protein SMC n=1 Tax=Micromonospora endophytica TaxID=515350 RepID=A0A2W2E8A2_9ACTN|nr:AAA family ATPase [Micromonospora endophytica]PZG01154.1 chromosome segregation protein SMC [Micromonospora endophytica]RIW42117.1 chromosome segregation protein SMC [Micromonospora endophytica]BCJ61817.1 chromosome segregation protein SMC [Micromonospora endophytica]